MPPTGSLAFTPVANEHGTATITVTVEDGGPDGDLATEGDNDSFSRTFDVTVSSVNDPPTLDAIADQPLPGQTISEDATQQKMAAERILKNGLSVRATEDLTSQLQRGGKSTSTRSSGKATPDVHVTSLQNKLTEHLGTKVALNYRKGKGAVKIQFYSDDDLERILGLLGIDSD